MDNIDWNAVLHMATIAGAGWVGYNVLQWIVPDVIAPLVGLAIAWRASSVYVKWKRAQMAALARQPEPENVTHLTRARALRVSRAPEHL